MFTIRDCLAFDCIPWSRNLLSKEGNLDRVIDYVSVNDLPLDDFLRKNEAVIAIATPYVKQPALMFEFVKGLVEADASVFLLSIPGDEMELDERSRRYAEDNGLCVYLIPWNVRFADIIENILDNIHYLYEKDLETFKAVQSELLTSFLKNDELDRGLDLIAAKLSCDVALSYPDGTLIGRRKILKIMEKIPLIANDTPYAYFHFDREMSQKSANMLQYTLSPLLSLWFYRDELIETTHRIAKDDFVRSLAEGADMNNPETIRTAELMNFKLKREYSCIVGRINLNGNINAKDENNWIESNISDIQTYIARLATALKYSIMVTHYENQLIIYFENRGMFTKQSIDSFLADIEKYVSGMNGMAEFSWGVSEIKEGPTEYKNYYVHAKLAAELCSYEAGRSNRFFYESSLVYTIMSKLFDDDEFFDDTLDIVKPVIDYERRKNNGIIDTLKVYLATRSVAETSRILDSHRQTVLYRLARIEELTNMSLKNYDDLYLLETCVRLHFGMEYTK